MSERPGARDVMLVELRPRKHPRVGRQPLMHRLEKPADRLDPARAAFELEVCGNQVWELTLEIVEIHGYTSTTLNQSKPFSRSSSRGKYPSGLQTTRVPPTA